MLTDVGLTYLGSKYTTEAVGPGGPLYEMFHLYANSILNPHLLRLGLTEKDIADRDAVYKYPDAKIIHSTMVSAWARRP